MLNKAHWERIHVSYALGFLLKKQVWMLQIKKLKVFENW